jgi:prepilin-type N-terminal cleavage/methylation domain-containing protein
MNFRLGFTLFELVIVLAILAAMVTVIAPYASRSNEHLKLDNQVQEVSETLKYAINLAETENQKVRFYLDTNQKSFSLQTADEDGDFYPISGPVGSPRFLSPGCHLMDIEGFEMDSQSCCLEFNPAINWPAAQFSIWGEDFKKTIMIQSKTVIIQDEGEM